jgi:hypothetical protein
LNFHYSAFGLSLHSNLHLPGLIAMDFSASTPEVQMHLGALPHTAKEVRLSPKELVYASYNASDSGEPALRVWQVDGGALFSLSYANGMQFWLDQRGTEIWASWPETSSVNEAATYLLGPVLGVLLRLRGIVCIHASAVAVGGNAIAFVGPAGAGKSTTAAIFALRGCAVISDDIVALAEELDTFLVPPAYPHVRLWPDSVGMLYGSPDRLPRFVPDWEKRCLTLGRDELKFEDRSLPLGVIYLLQERTSDSRSLIGSVSLPNAFMALVANSYATQILDRQMRAKEFDVLSRLVPRVPVYSLEAPRDEDGFDDFYDVVCRDVKRMEVQEPEIGCCENGPRADGVNKTDQHRRASSERFQH